MFGVKVNMKVECETLEKAPLHSMDETIGSLRCGINAIGLEGNE